MAMKARRLRVTLSLPYGDVVLTEELKMNIRVFKAALAIQNRASIDVVGLSQKLREQLLSQFTAWNKRLVETGQKKQEWVNVKIEAGYADEQFNETISTVFVGQVVLVQPTSPPPNIGVRITCYSRQIDKTAFVSAPAPAQTTFFGYVKWAAEQMGFGSNFVCDTSYNNVIIQNPARSILTNAALLVDIQNIYRPDVAAFIDDELLIVKDRNKIINLGDSANLTEFVGVPCWTEWGVEGTVMYDGAVKMAQAATFTSLMNPSVNGIYVTTELEYDLSSRDRPFYVRVSGSPPA